MTERPTNPTPAELGELMKAVVTTHPGHMEVQARRIPAVEPGQALVAVEAVGLCGSDFHLYDGRHPYARFPQVQGHELIGTVTQLPDGYDQSLALGERVVVEPMTPCGQCFPCRRGKYNCCVNLHVMGAHVAGGLVEYLTVPTARLHSVGDLPPLVAVLVEPLTVGMQCVVRADAQPGDTVVVVGAGPIGQAAVLCAVDRGARVMVVDRVASRLRLARALGAEVVTDTTTDDWGRAVTDFTEGDGAAVVVEATGSAELLQQSLDVAAHSGTVVVVGISDQAVTIPVGLFSRKEINVLGSRNSAGLFPMAVELARKYQKVIAPMVTHTYGLDQTPEAIEYAMHNPAEVEKAVILMKETQW